jgi:predicted amidohydrolase
MDNKKNQIIRIAEEKKELPRVFIAQMNMDPFNLEKNCKKVQEYFKQAWKAGCDFIVFPEYMNGNYTPWRISNKDNNYFLQNISKNCKKYGIYAIAGTILVKTKRKCYNRCHIFDESGRLVGYQDKLSLDGVYEQKYVYEGREQGVFDTKFGKIGIMICRDFLYQEITDNLVKKGADIIFCPANWCSDMSFFKNANLPFKVPNSSELNVLKTSIPARAISGEAIIIFCNSGGEVKLNDNYWFKCGGHSQIASPFFGTKECIRNTKEGSLIADIDLKPVLASRDKAYRIHALKRNIFWNNLGKKDILQ